MAYLCTVANGLYGLAISNHFDACAMLPILLLHWGHDMGYVLYILVRLIGDELSIRRCTTSVPSVSVKVLICITK